MRTDWRSRSSWPAARAIRGLTSAVRRPPLLIKEMRSQAEADQDDHPADHIAIETPCGPCSQVTAEDGSDGHAQGVTPFHFPLGDKHGHGDAVDTGPQDVFQSVHAVNITEAHETERAQHQN